MHCLGWCHIMTPVEYCSSGRLCYPLSLWTSKILGSPFHHHHQPSGSPKRLGVNDNEHRNLSNQPSDCKLPPWTMRSQDAIEQRYALEESIFDWVFAGKSRQLVKLNWHIYIFICPFFVESETCFLQVESTFLKHVFFSQTKHFRSIP